MKINYTNALFLALSIHTIGSHAVALSEKSQLVDPITSQDKKANTSIYIPTLSQPSFSTSGAAFNESHNTENLKKKFRFDPILEVNQNRGTLSSQIQIPLFVNSLGLESLDLLYHHTNQSNTGLGIGFNWNLPFIQAQKDVSNSSRYTATGMLGSLDLVESIESADKYKKIVTDLGSKIGLTGLIEFKIFRPLVESNGTLFLQIQNSESVKWVALTLNGSRWVFNHNGQPIHLLNKNFLKMNFNWEGALLLGVYDQRTQNRLTVQYLKQLSKTPRYFQGLWQKFPMGIERVYITHATQQKELVFNYDLLSASEEGGLLLSVYWQRGVLPLWQGKYQDHESIKSQLSKTMPAIDAEKSQYVYKNSLTEVTTVDKNKDLLYADIDGDGREDQIEISAGKVENEIKHLISNIITGNAKDNSLKLNFDHAGIIDHIKNKIHPLQRIKIYKAYTENNSSEISYKYDAALSASIQNLFLSTFDVAPFFAPPIRDYFNTENALDKNSALAEISKIKVTPLIGGMHFMDLNGSGVKSLLFCPGVKELAEPTRVEGLTTEKSLSATVLHVAKIYNPNLNFTAPNIEATPGAHARLFIQVPHQKNIEEQWLQEGQFRKTRTSNTLINATEFKEIHVEGLKCHQESLIVEFAPGLTGIWTGGRLTLLGGIENQKLVHHTVAMPLKEIVQSEELSQSDLINEKLTLIPTGEGKLRLIKADHTVFFSQDGTLAIQNKSTPYEIRYGFRYPILSSAPSPFGGRIDIQYGRESGEFVVKSKIYKPLGNQPNVAHLFYYRAPLRDQFRNTFIGFHSVQEVIESTAKNFRPQLVDRLFFKDNLDSVVLFKQRLSRLNGLMYKEQIRSRDGKTLYQTLERKYAIYDLKNDRIFPNIEEETNIKHNPEGREQIYLRRIRPQAHWEQIENKTLLFPLTQVERAEGAGLQSAHTDKMLDYVHEKIQFNRVNSNYVMETYKETLRGKDNQKSSEDITREFDASGNIRSECQGPRCQFFEYDSLGRLTLEKSTKGDITTNTYQGSFPLAITTERQNLKQTNEYDFLSGHLLSSTNNYGLQYSNSYTDDGILVRQTELNQNGKKIIFDLKTQFTYCSQQNAHECRQPQVVEYQEHDQNKVLYLDGLGRTENQSKIINGKLFYSGQMLFGINDVVYIKNLSGFEQKTNKEFEIADIDELGRPVQKWLANGDVIQNNYTHQCESQFLNNNLILRECKNSAGQLTNVFTDGQGFQMSVDELGQVQSISGIESVFKWSPFGELISTTAANKQFWSTESRKFDEQGKDIRYAYPQIDIKRNEFLQILSTKHLSIDSDNRVDENFIYEKDRLVSTQSRFGEKQSLMTRRYEYNDRGQLISNEGSGFKVSYDYDQYGKLNSVQASGNQHQKNLSISYNSSELSAIGSEFEVLERGENFREVKKSKLMNSLLRENAFVANSTLLNGITYKSPGGQVLWSEGYGYNDLHQTVERKSYSALESTKTERFNYNIKTQALEVEPLSAEVKKSIVRESGYVKELRDLSLSFQSNQLAYVDSTLFYYDAFGRFRGACLGKKDCLIKIDDDHYFWNQGVLSVVRVDGAPVTFSYKGSSYPLITDKIGSVRGLVSADGKTLLFTRSYGAYGEKSIKINAQLSAEQQKQARELEKLVIWGYAGLIELPWKLGEFSDARLYISQSRVYSPDAREWVSPDSYVKWNPQAAITTPWDLHPFRYARNQPLDFVDPSGNAAQWVVATVGAGVTWITTFGLTYMTTNDPYKSVVVASVSSAMTFISISSFGLFTWTSSQIAGFVSVASENMLARGMHAASMGTLNAGVQYYQNKDVDLLGITISTWGGSPSGAAMRWGVSTGSSLSIAGVKSFLSSMYTWTYKTIKGSYKNENQSTKSYLETPLIIGSPN